MTSTQPMTKEDLNAGIDLLLDNELVIKHWDELEAMRRVAARTRNVPAEIAERFHYLTARAEALADIDYRERGDE